MASLQTFFAHFPGFGLVLLECVIICLQYTLSSLPISRLRAQYFSKAFFEQHFPAFRDRCPAGYPDMGHGRFAAKLTDEQWYNFNNAQRVHGNFLEQLPTALVLLLTAGLGAPRVAVPAGALYIVGRFMFGAGYLSQGAKGRRMGGRLSYMALITLLGASLYTVWTMTGGVAGLSNFVQSYTKL